MAAEGQSDTMASDSELHMKRRYVIGFVTSSGADLYEHGMQTLVQRQKCTANGGGYGEKWCLMAENLL